MTNGERPPERAVQHALLRWSLPSGQALSSRGQVRSASPKRLAVTLAAPRPTPEQLPLGQALEVSLATTAGLATVPARLGRYQPATGLVIVTVALPFVVAPPAAVKLPLVRPVPPVIIGDEFPETTMPPAVPLPLLIVSVWDALSVIV